MKKVKAFVEILLIVLLFAQLLYIFEGNLAHEIMGIAFFVLVAAHVFLKLSEMVYAAIDCDVKAITLTGERYPSSYNATISVAIDEIRNDIRPEIEPIDISGYDSVILIYPLWWGTIPAPVSTFLEANNWEGKNLFLLATQGSSGFGTSVRDIKKTVPNANVYEGLSIYCDDIPNCFSDIDKWVKEVF